MRNFLVRFLILSYEKRVDNYQPFYIILLLSIRLYVKSEVHDITIFYNVRFTFNT